MQFADSEVATVRLDGDELRVRCSAAAVIDPSGTAGYLKSVELVFSHPTWRGDPGLCFGRLTDGKLVFASSSVRTIPVPHHSDSACTAELQFRHGEALSIACRVLTIRVVEPAAFFESFAC